MKFTTEKAFQAHIDQNPTDYFARTVFADWLDDQGDPRAAGYRALGTIERRSMDCRTVPGEVQLWVLGKDEFWRPLGFTWGPCTLPPLWYHTISVRGIANYNGPPGNGDPWKYFRTRRAAENAAAKGFTYLTDDQRAAVLTKDLYGS